MSQLAPRLVFTYDDDLEWEQRQPERHEYVCGAVFAMAGTTDRRHEISMNFTLLLRQHWRGTPCQAYMTDVKVRVEAANCGFYPDVQVTRVESDRADYLVKRLPVRAVEVFDWGDTLVAYQQLDIILKQ